jgi:AcrR family transcriptional regulator
MRNSTKSVSATRAARTQSASQQRREQERRDLRELILKAAGDEFLEKGYDTFSLRRIAERIGYTPTTIYLHFRNKDDLLLATVQEGFEAFDKQMEQTAAAHPDPIKRIEALGRAYIEFGLRNPALYRLMFMQRSDFYFMPRFTEDNDSDDGPITNGDNRAVTMQTATENADAETVKIAGTARNKAAAKTNDARVQGVLANGAVTGNKTSSKSAPASGVVERPRTVAMTLLVAAVEEAMTAGKVKTTEPIIAADVLWAGAHGLVSLAISPLMSPEHARKVTDSLLATLINGVQLC